MFADPGAASPRAPRSLTRYLPSGENLQSRLESLNTSEKFMAAAGPGARERQPCPAELPQPLPPRPEVTEDESTAQPIRTPGARAALWGL